MQDTVNRQFISALASVGSEILGSEHPLISKIDAAGPSPDVQAVHDIQDALAALPEEMRDALMSAVHKRMREDISAIWTHLPHASDNKPN